MQLSTRIIVREEVDCFLLYNGDNGGLISLEKSTFEGLAAAESNPNRIYTDLVAWLGAYGFLEGELSQHCGTPQVSAELLSDSAHGFFGLRSQISPLNVLWSITPACNLRCLYCFPNVSFHSTVTEALTLSDLLSIADKLIESRVLKVTLSGGECLLHNGLWTIVERLRSAGLTVAILTNGTAISRQVAEQMSKNGVIVGVSLDGQNEEVNRTTRGRGAFEKTVTGIKRLVAESVPVTILVTVTRHNYPILEELIAFISDLGILSITLQDLRPFGTRNDYDRLRLTVEQERTLPTFFDKLSKMRPDILINPTELFIFSQPGASGRLMHCPAGDNFAYIDFYGDVYPCTSLPSFWLGNILGDVSLSVLWQESDAILRLRRMKTLPVTVIQECTECSNRVNCEGGCRGDALFYRGDLMGLPSRCPKALGILV